MDHQLIERGSVSRCLQCCTFKRLSTFILSLPKMDLPKFSGKLSDWENFRDVFRSIIYRRKDLSPIMKLHYLHTHLTGEALEKIKSLSITNDNYDRAWAALVEYYENHRRIVGSHIAEIFSVKSMKSIAREIFNPIASLNSLNRALH